jgi:hypothetical protein
MLTNSAAFTGGTVEFKALATGFPNPKYQWFFNGEILAGQRTTTLILTNLSVTNAGTYSLTASNAAGIATTSALLTIFTRTNDLRITEVMSSEAPADLPTSDWWELTNFGSDPVDLSGWRFNDSIGGLSDPFVFPEGVFIEPTETMIFVENLTPEEFKGWWGESNFLPDAKIVTYSGSALSFRATGDSVILWNRTATDVNNTEARFDFGQADVGVSFIYDPISEQFGAKSQIGVHGAFRAEGSTDIGSPGRIKAEETAPLKLEINASANLLELHLSGQAENSYLLEISDDLSVWKTTGLILSETNLTSVIPAEMKGSPRFFRLRRL